MAKSVKYLEKNWDIHAVKVPQADPTSGTESLQPTYSWAPGRCFSTTWMLFLFFFSPRLLINAVHWGCWCDLVFVLRHLRAAWALSGWCCTFGLIIQHLPDNISLPGEPKRSELSGYIHMCTYRYSRLMMPVYNGEGSVLPASQPSCREQLVI